ncbi:MAG: rod-binding protein [Treponema sp.]|nr:rod-binding protein [Treponema sp.]
MMDIGSIGMQFSQANPLASAQGLRDSREGSSFDEVLRRLQNMGGSQTRTPSAQIPSFVQDLELYEACLEFETILLKNLIQGMRKTIDKSSLIETGFAGEVYEDMLYDEYTKSFTRNANLGFAAMAYRELSGQRA